MKNKYNHEKSISLARGFVRNSPRPCSKSTNYNGPRLAHLHIQAHRHCSSMDKGESTSLVLEQFSFTISSCILVQEVTKMVSSYP